MIAEVSRESRRVRVMRTSASRSVLPPRRSSGTWRMEPDRQRLRPDVANCPTDVPNWRSMAKQRSGGSTGMGTGRPSSDAVGAMHRPGSTAWVVEECRGDHGAQLAARMTARVTRSQASAERRRRRGQDECNRGHQLVHGKTPSSAPPIGGAHVNWWTSVSGPSATAEARSAPRRRNSRTLPPPRMPASASNP